jgi:superfamily II DNA or RNA helicase
MTQKQIDATEIQLKKITADLMKPHTQRILDALSDRKAELEMHLLQADAHKKITSVLTARQKAYRDWLTDNLTDAGLMIHAVDAKKRFGYIKTKRMIFAITKYGREGLDDEWLDTVLVSTPFSKRNTLQQLIGRPTRQKPGKRSPLIVFYEDDVGPLIGMCKKLRRHLNAWPMEENGPFEFELHGHPKANQWNQNTLFGP